jgi:integrase
LNPLRDSALVEGCGKTALTREVYTHHLDGYILPRWGAERRGDIKAFRVESWLSTLEKKPSIREVRQSVKRLREPDVLEPEELASLLEHLSEPSRTLVITATVTGLRRGELIGLKWEDIDFQKGKINVVRSLVDHIEGQPKKATSRRPVPLTPALASVLEAWKQLTAYSMPGDFPMI